MILCLVPSASIQDIVVTQSPGILSPLLGSTVTISCKSSKAINNDMCLLRKVPGQRHETLFYETSRKSGVSDRFSASGYDYDFTFKITNVQPEDEGSYYCWQSNAYPLTQ
ncbi:KV117 protein, partial [Polypterus senegalus]